MPRASSWRSNAAWRAFAANNGGNDDAVGRNYLDVCDRVEDPYTTRLAAGIRALLAGGTEPVEVEYPCHSPTQQQWFVATAVVHRETGRARVVVQHPDITIGQRVADRQRAESKILDQLAAAVIATDLDHRITSWNRAAEEQHGWSAAEILGQPFGKVLIPAFAAEAFGRTLWPLDDDHEWTGQLDLQRKDGSVCPAHVRVAPLCSADGTVAGYIGVSMDLTERLRIDRELAVARDHLRAVTDHMGEGLCTLDASGHLTYLNPTANAMLGTDGTDVTGMMLSAFLAGRREAESHPSGDLVIETSNCTIRSDDEVLCGLDGSRTPVSVSATPLQDSAGTSWVVVLTDVTGRKAREEELEQEVEAISWLASLQAALHEDRIILHAKPIIELATGRVMKHELLLRMHDPEEGLIMPGRFIPAAEQLGFMPTLNRWVIDRGLALAATGMPVELNLCGGSFSDSGLVPHVRAALDRTGADPSTVIFDVTETDLVHNLEQAHDMLIGLQALGSRSRWTTSVPAMQGSPI